jgi:hypothetical protein
VTLLKLLAPTIIANLDKNKATQPAAPSAKDIQGSAEPHKIRSIPLPRLNLSRAAH